MMKSFYNLIFIILCLIIITQTRLIIQPSESIVSVHQYKSFIALCSGNENVRVVSWQSAASPQTDIKIEKNSRVTVERKKSALRLRIRNVTKSDGGIWTCTGIDENGKSISNTLQIFVKIPITFVSEPIQYAELNSIALIKCKVISNPSAEITWFKGQDRVEAISSEYEQTSDGLKIKRASVLDNDIFWCQADVIETGESKEYEIQVILAQAITSPKITCLAPCAVEKRTATLICEANGIPSPQATWFYGENNHAIISGLSKYEVRGNRLIINRIDETDAGRYSCHVFNDFDKRGKYTEYMLSVNIPPQLASIPPVDISINDHDTSSKQASFICRVDRASTEDLSMQWFYANRTLIETTDSISIDTSQEKTRHYIKLIFDPVRPEHHGNYTCLVKNVADSASVVARLMVKYRPFVIEPNTSEVWSAPGHQIILKCRISSFPPPIIQWIRTNQDDYTSSSILTDASLQVINILTNPIDSTLYETQLTYHVLDEDFGFKFECRANNSLLGQHSVLLRRGESPGQVRILSAEPNSNKINVYVELPQKDGGLPLLQYIVHYEQANARDSLKIALFPVKSDKKQKIEITSLKPAHNYRIQIAVENLAGQSIFSTPIQVMTLAGEVPQFSLSNMSCLNGSSCLIKWFVHLNDSSDISKIEILYATMHGFNKIGTWSKPIQVEPTITEYELKELKPSTSYTIAVRLFNAAGESEKRMNLITTKFMSKCKIGCTSKPNMVIIIGIIASSIIGTLIVCIILVSGRALAASSKKAMKATPASQSTAYSKVENH